MFLLFSEEKLHFSHIILIINELPLILPIIFVSSYCFFQINRSVILNVLISLATNVTPESIL